MPDTELFPVVPPTLTTDGEESPSAPSVPPPSDSRGPFDFTQGLAGLENPSPVAGFARPRGKRAAPAGPMPGAKAELEDIFTPEGIGQIAAKSLDAFYRACGAAPLELGERNTIAKISAAYCQTRLPADASAYQPEILLVFAIGSTLVTRPEVVGKIAEKSAPVVSSLWDRVTGFAGGVWSRFFGKKGGDNAATV